MPPSVLIPTNYTYEIHVTSILGTYTYYDNATVEFLTQIVVIIRYLLFMVGLLLSTPPGVTMDVQRWSISASTTEKGIGNLNLLVSSLHAQVIILYIVLQNKCMSNVSTHA